MQTGGILALTCVVFVISGSLSVWQTRGNHPDAKFPSQRHTTVQPGAPNTVVTPRLPRTSTKIGNIDPEVATNSDVQFLLGVIQNSKQPQNDRELAAMRLGRIPMAASEGTDVLLSVIRSEPKRIWAIKAISRFKQDAAGSGSVLLDIVHSGQPAEKLAALDALGQIGPTPKTIQFLFSELQRLRALPVIDNTDLAIIQIAGQIGGSAAVCLPSLVRLLEHPQASARSAAAVALGKFGERAGLAVNRLADVILADAEFDVRADAVAALIAIGPQAISTLVQILKTTDEDVACEIIRGLAEFDRSDVRREIREQFDNPSEVIQLTAAIAMTQSTPDDTAAIEVLLRFLVSPNRQFRMRAVRSLARIPNVSGNANVRAHLENMLRSPDPVLRTTAKKALREIRLHSRSAS